MKVIVTGATGLAGSEVVRECLKDPNIERVMVLARRPIGIEDSKLVTVLHDDFSNYDPAIFKGYDACFWCLGIAQSKVSVAEYEKITFDYAVAAANAMYAVNPNFTFCFLSGGGTDSTEKSRTTFARVKGRTENALMKAHERVYCFRPSYIRPVRPMAERGWGLRAMDNTVAPLLELTAKRFVINTDVLGRAMIRVAREGSPTHVLENSPLRTLGA